MNFRTLTIHGAYHPDFQPDAVPPMHLSTTFEHRDGSDWLYLRAANPNRLMLEKLLAKLENANHGFAFSSGVAAVNAVFQSLPVGCKIVAGKDLYNGTRMLLEQLKIWKNAEIYYEDLSLNWNRNRIGEIHPDLIWLETPSNPGFVVSDIQEISTWAHQNGILVAVDSTWMTPVFMNPLQLGADFVVHSATKYFGGHSDILGGAVLVNDGKLAEKIKQVQLNQGAVLAPFDSWLLVRSIKTMDVRVRIQTENAQKLAVWLNEQTWVHHVAYPGLYKADEKLVFEKQSSGTGAMISFRIKADEQLAKRFAASVSIIINATSLGGVESTWEHRFSSEGPLSPTPKDLIRFSVGLEDVEDLQNDILEAAEKVGLV
ncbi:PLP-dependent transferase [bacterium]|nr:MAG: PLP-dependent transferase [bacterium]